MILITFLWLPCIIILGHKLYGPLLDQPGDTYGIIKSNVKIPPKKVFNTEPKRYGLPAHYIPVEALIFKNASGFEARPANLFNQCSDSAWKLFVKFCTQVEKKEEFAHMLNWLDLDHIFKGAHTKGEKCHALGDILPLMNPQAILTSTNISIECLETATKGLVTNKVFHQVYPKISNSMIGADFFSLDTIYTGDRLMYVKKKNYFDSLPGRYYRMQSNMSNDLKMIQLGLSIFSRPNSAAEKYQATRWTFFLPATPSDFNAHMMSYHSKNKVDLAKSYSSGIVSLPLGSSPNPIGISQLIQHLMILRKPILFFSAMNDILFMIKTFISGTMPKYLNEYKTKAMELSSSIIDMKHIINEIVQPVNPNINARRLADLNGHVDLVPSHFEPARNPLFIGNTCAGENAFLTGIIFLRICSMLSSHYARSWQEILQAFLWRQNLAPATIVLAANKVFVVNQASRYIDLANKQPTLHIFCVKSEQRSIKFKSLLPLLKAAVSESGIPESDCYMDYNLHHSSVMIHFKKPSLVNKHIALLKQSPTFKANRLILKN